MAEEVPISEVLCNAMEYLCKLGSNLRTRSQNLMDKRIRKEKLRNVHAVRKASSKVLLICELSRKSLENVENSVKRVLTLVDASRFSPPLVGAKNENVSSKECFYIEYDSCKLRISEKIFLNHYTSVKVQAKQMPPSMIDKYPVYYNCTLYRKRKQDENNKSSGDAACKSVKKVKELEVYDEKENENMANSSESDKHSKEKQTETKAENEQLKGESRTKKNKKKIEKEGGYRSDDSAKSNKEKNKVNECEKFTETKGRNKTDSTSEDSDDSSKNKAKDHKKDETDKSASESEHKVIKETQNVSKITKEPDSSQDEDEQKNSGKSDNEIDNAGSKQQAESKSSKNISSKPSKRSDRHSEESKSSGTSKDTSKKSKQSKKSKSTRFPDSDSDSSEKLGKHVTGNESKRMKLDKENGKKSDKTVEPEVVDLIDDSPKKSLDSKGSDKHSKEKQTETKADHEQLKGESRSKKNKKKIVREGGYRSDDSAKSNKDKNKVNESEKFTETKMKDKNDSKSEDSDDSSKNKAKDHKKDETDKSASETEHKVTKETQNVSKITKELDSSQDEDEQKNSGKSDNEIDNASSKQQAESKSSKNISSKPSKRSDRHSEESKSSGTSKDTSKKSKQSKKSKSTRIPDSDSDSSEKLGKHVTGNESKRLKLDKENGKKSDKTVEPEVVDLIDDSPKKSPDSKGSENDNKSNEDSDSNEKKPMIKLVSLSKLLKPDVLKKEMSGIDKKNENKRNVSATRSSRSCKENSKNSYQEKMRKEVRAFKPKKFDVVVTRLPTFSDSFLCKYGLKRITQNGSEVYSVESESKNKKDEKLNLSIDKESESKNKKDNKLNLSADKKSSSKSKSKEKKISEKNDLTDDSDTKEIDEVIGKAKLSLLNSDSDDVDAADKKESKNEKNSNHDSNEKKDKQENKKSKGPDKNENKNEESEENLASNSDIVEVVSLDSPKTPVNKNTETEKTTPQSRRKLMMESMRAKKMLLTYSSSSDTEDEELRSTMKDIKSALLKNSSSSSDDEIDVKKIIERNRKKLVSSSDSEGSLKIPSKSKRAKQADSDKKELDDSSISQMDGTNDELSNSGSSQMGRSKTKVTSSHRKQSTENVDTNESEINRLTNLKTITTRSRRRRSVDKPTRSNPKMPKAPPIKDEILAPASSGSGSDSSEHEVDEMEELPPVPLQGMNGDSLNAEMNCMAKEDLLATSEPSSSDNDNDKTNNSDEDKKDDESDEDNVKAIRRKANAITSDSEAESARRKARKISDFEESEDESSEPRKTKRKKKVSDSDCSLSSSDAGKKKRKRIKQVNESDGSGSDTETEGKNKHGRKNIRKVMSKDQLEEATKKAARQEKERIARISERQKLYNNLEFDESGKPDEVVLDKVVLDFDPETKEPLIEVDRGLVKKLKPHQANGIKFMWNACFESVKRIKKDRGSGCILAHCMGLGKTLQVVSLTHTLLIHSDLTKVKRVLVVCPLSTVLNWVNEFTMWLKHAESDYEVEVFELSRHKQNSERSWQLQQWVECGGVCVLGYEMFRNLSADNNKKYKKKMLKTFQEALVDPGPDMVVCDEGHLLKNEKTSLSQSMNRVRTMRRIVLTGTPLQNNLKEYYCMVQFVKPNLLGKYNEYLNRFVNPITNGQYTDSTERDISVMKRRSHVLHTMLDGAVQRRDYGVLAPFLPPKHEYVLFITLSDIQIKLYQHYLDNYSRRPLPGRSSGFLFPDFQSLQRIWTHPLVLKYNSERYEIMQQKKRDKEEEDSEGSLADFIDDESTPDESSTEESSDDLSDMSDDSRKKSKKKAKAKKAKAKDAKASARRNTRANPVELEDDKPILVELEDTKYENPTEWWMKLVTEEELEDIRHSHKLLLLFDILRQCEAIGDKLLVFSQSLYSLDLIEHFLGKVDEATQEARIDEKLAGHVGSWSPGVDYFRLDGSTSCENRSIWCKNFNREDNPRARLFLISTRAGGLGINLVAANRVVIFDVSWNPSHDVQSIFRVYRFGQKKPCYIYRFLAMGTMEEKIYERQVTKQAISKRVIDEQQIDRHYAANDLAELYKFEPVPVEPRPVPSLPKDRLFAEMLKDHEKQIFRFHEHDSLLENKEEETLSEEERKKAWEEFENEKKAPPPSPFPNSWSMHNGMASLLQQQQQQLAYAALAAMIRKDMPNINDNQIRDMLPIICNANPGMFGGYDYGLMQKMSEIYKYAPPGMMNPSMMNPVMNPAAGGGMSTSSLQYEPPWQRQQQQQQQMRLQQLMQQQQQSMGASAKYYAGGLGSRDPVAMALQQQRAREFLGGPAGAPAGAGAGAPGPAGVAATGRPRGRPPLQPRAPTAQDVVNLDSD